MPPEIDPKLAAQQAMAEYDTNSDGTIDGAELDKVPAIKNSLKEIDKDGDGRVSEDEIRERIEQWQASKVAIMPFNCKVTLDRAPLVGATVTLVPKNSWGPKCSRHPAQPMKWAFPRCRCLKKKCPTRISAA